MPKQIIVPDEKGRAFSRAIRAGQFLFISGMTGQWDLTTWERDPKSLGNIEYQTRRIYEWLQQVLAKSGLTMKDVVSSTTFVRRIADNEIVGRVKREFMPEGDVASTSVAVSDFVGTGDLEINFIALYPEGR